MAAIAVFSVGISALLSNWQLESRLADAARQRLAIAAEHSAELAASHYREHQRWNTHEVHDLRHVAQAGKFAVVVYGRDGKPLPGSNIKTLERAKDRVDVPVVVGGRTVGTVAFAPRSGELLTATDRDLRASLDRLHLFAAALAAGLGLVVGIIIAIALARPLKRLTSDALRMAKGDLSVPMKHGGGTEIEQLSSALGQLADTLKQQEALRKQSVGDIAHELRTPLAGIVSRIEAAQDGVFTDEQSNLQALHTEAWRFASRIDDLERLAEADQPELFVVKAPVDLAEVARSRADTYGDFFSAKGVSFHQELTSVCVQGDEGRLDQIVDNLLSNALRYTESGGSVTIRVGVEDGCAVLEVDDTGIGIAREELDNIFERFWRGERARVLATDGAGIGLAVVEELVLVHGGRMEVDSEPGKGSCFRLTLPISDRQASRIQGAGK